MKRVCNIFNTPSHYRLKIYSLLDEEYECKFLFGDEDLKVRRFDLKELKDASFVHVRHLGHFVFQQGIISYIFKKYDFYVLTAGTNDLSQWVLLLLSKLFRKKKVYVWSHGIYGYESKMRMLVRKAYFGLADGLFIYGNFARQNMIREGFKPDRLHLIHNSLDYDQQLKIRKVIKRDRVYLDYFQNSYPILIFIGRLTEVKKLNQLLTAVALLRQKGELYNVIFVGDGEEKEKLMLQTKQLGLDNNIWFYGACYDELENAKLLYNADLCVSPGNVGLTSVHSLMFGTPVLTHNDFVWQMPEYEVIDEWKTGCFFERDNVEDLAKKIMEWFTKNGQSRDEIRKACYSLIDSEWNPYYQMNVFKQVFGE